MGKRTKEEVKKKTKKTSKQRLYHEVGFTYQLKGKKKKEVWNKNDLPNNERRTGHDSGSVSSVLRQLGHWQLADFKSSMMAKVRRKKKKSQARQGLTRSKLREKLDEVN